MEQGRFLSWFEVCKPYLFLTLNELCLSIFMILVQTLVSAGVSALVIVVYEHVVATIVLSILAFFLEKNKRPPLAYNILFYAFLLGLLQITLCQILMTLALEYVASTYESIALNLVPSIVFVLAVIFHQEKLRCWSINGQAKIWGLAISTAGALAMILWTGPALLMSTLLSEFHAISESVIGGFMIAVGVLAASFWSILMVSMHTTKYTYMSPERHVTSIYRAELSLTAMMNLFGTIQTAVVTAFVISRASWELKCQGGIVLTTILLGGIVVTGLSYYVMTWSIKKRGPVFTASFSPFLVLFSFLLETFVLGSSPHLGSIVGAILVVAGLYLILWAKAHDLERIEMVVDDSIDSPLIQP